MSIIDTLPPDIACHRLLNPKDTAALLGVTVPQLHRMRNAGDIPLPLRISDRRMCWRVKDLLTWIESRRLRSTTGYMITMGDGMSFQTPVPPPGFVEPDDYPFAGLEGA